MIIKIAKIPLKNNSELSAIEEEAYQNLNQF